MVYFLNYRRRTIFSKSLLGVLGFLLFPLLLQANYLEKYISSSVELSSQEFCENIDFDHVLNVPETDQVAYYSEIEKILEAHNRQADTFFLVFSEQYLTKKPVDIKNMTSLKDYLVLGKFLIGHESKYYAIAADYIFVALTDAMTIGFKDATLDKSNDSIMSIVAELKEQQYLVSIPTSNLDKGMHHLKKGNLRYIWSRLWFDYPVLCIVGILLLGFIAYSILKKIKKS